MTPLGMLDSLEDLRSAWPKVAGQIRGKPKYYGQYLGVATTATIQAAHALGFLIVLILGWGQITGTDAAGCYDDGVRIGQRMISLLRALGAPYTVIPWVDIEAGWQITEAFVRGLADTMAESEWPVIGLYGDPYDPYFQAAWLQARSTDAHAASLRLWTSEPEPGCTGLDSLPEWGPATVGGVEPDIWQCAEGVLGAVDVDEVHEAFTGGWAPPPPGYFADVPASEWDATAIASVVNAGIVQGYPDGTFRPAAPLSRGEFCEALSRALHLAPPSISLAQRITVTPRAKRHGYGARMPKPKPGLLHFRHIGVVGPAFSGFTMVDHPEWLQKLDQKDSEECVWFSGVNSHYYAQQKRGAAGIALGSPSWGYGKTHLVNNDPNEGTDPAEALEVMQRYGVCPWNLDPFPSSGAQTLHESEAGLTTAMDEAAEPYRIGSYAVVNPTPDDISAALANGPVMIDSDVFPGFETPEMLPIQNMPDALAAVAGKATQIAQVLPGCWLGQQSVGGHQYLCIGRIARQPFLPAPGSLGCDTYKVCLNSWGMGWGSDGVFLLPDTYPIWAAWVITSMLSGPCAALAANLASLRQFEQQYPNIPPAHKAAIHAQVQDLLKQAAAIPGCSLS